MLKLITLKKLKEDYPEVKARMVLPGGLDVNRVTLPVILSFNQGQDHQNTSLVAPEKTKKNKTAGFLGLFKSSPEQQEPNNATGICFTNISKICIQVQGVHVHCIDIVYVKIFQKHPEDPQQSYRMSPSQLSVPRQDCRDKIH